MIDRSHPLSVTRQCRVLNLSRSGVYYQPRPESFENLALMRRMDALHMDRPSFGSRGLMKLLRREGHNACREKISRLMRLMGIQAIYRKPNSSKPHPSHPVYPYLLRHLTIDRPNQVWAADITYIPMSRGFVYLVAIMDWASRRVLSWRLSNTLMTDFCVEALQEAMHRYGTPEIFNTDQGSQFTSLEFTGQLQQNNIVISMDGKGCWRDNVFVERLWRSVKYEEVYLRAYSGVIEARQGLENYFEFYNERRPHTALDNKTPEEFYLAKVPALHCAA